MALTSKIIDNISEMVQHGDIVTVED